MRIWVTGLRGIVSNAGLWPWPKVLNCLRSSKQADLAAAFPAQVVLRMDGEQRER